MAITKTFISAENIYANSEEIVWDAVSNLYLSVLIDKNGNIVYMNQKYCDFMNVTPEEVKGVPIIDLIPNTRLLDALKSGTPTFDDVFTYEDGRQLIYSRMPVKNSNGEIMGIVSISSLNTSDTVNELYLELESLKMSNELYAKQLRGLTSAPTVFDNIVGSSPAILEIKNTLNNMINTRMPILLTGESGTGKEVFANAIHNASEWRNAPFVRVNCAAIPKELLESELFGYEPGSFSGALTKGKAGKFELANNGTILLDEISELPLEMQTKLLRVLQEYEVERIGSINPKKLNLQVICCTNHDLYQLVQEKKFREDLLYRINVLEIEIPPLRERKEDIFPLCVSLISKINNKYKINIKGIDSKAIAYLSQYSWPGNVRELEHVIERAGVMVKDRILMVEDFRFLDSKLKKNESEQTPQKYDPEYLKTAEKYDIMSALEKAGGNRSKAAKILGISRSNLYNKLKKYSL